MTNKNLTSKTEEVLNIVWDIKHLCVLLIWFTFSDDFMPLLADRDLSVYQARDMLPFIISGWYR